MAFFLGDALAAVGFFFTAFFVDRAAADFVAVAFPPERFFFEENAFSQPSEYFCVVPTRTIVTANIPPIQNSKIVI